ncbi:MAG: UTP--glucose-1-phosphate uridylyltransferase [Eubacterium sp.]|nr:UTP--glucose-1-phosphate uridylyltransferase [Eubacterium sp.]
MAKVKKAVILAAGYGTRVLPASKAIPKEMLNIVDKPAIQYIVEEVINSGITDILIVVSRGKHEIEDHFDRKPDLEAQLLKGNKTEFYKVVTDIAEMGKGIQFVRQQEQNGTGGAVMYAKSFVGDDPFVVVYGDDVIIGDDPCTAQCCRAFEKYGKAVVSMKEVPFEMVLKYCTLDVKPAEGNVYHISDMIEKPKPEQVISNFSILGRCVLPAKVFDILETLPTGAGGEYQLTDAMKQLATTEGMIGVDFTGTRYDMGNKLGIMKACVEVALKHPEIGEGFKEYLKTLDI